LDANKPVSFRLSSNLTHFLGLSVDGHYSGALVAVARCFNSRQIQHLLRPILWDTFAGAVEDDTGMEINIASPVKRALEAIMGRIRSELGG